MYMIYLICKSSEPLNMGRSVASCALVYCQTELEITPSIVQIEKIHHTPLRPDIIFFSLSPRLLLRTFSNRCALALIMAQDIGKKAFKSIGRGHHHM